MFTGIVAGRGTVLALNQTPESGSAVLVLEAGPLLEGLEL